MSVVSNIKKAAANSIEQLYSISIQENDILVNATKPEFEGEYTIVLFPFIKQLRKSPEALGQEIGEHIVGGNPSLFSSFNIIKGFLNLSIAHSYWTEFLYSEYSNTAFGKNISTGKKIMVEYSSPNTNKPLHLGHLRNNFLGWSAAEILKAAGNEVVKTCVVNDRGIHICKSMLAWQKHGNGTTPESNQTKGDHFVGDFYVKFEQDLKTEAKIILEKITHHQLDGLSHEEETKVMALKNAMSEALKANNNDKHTELEGELNAIARNHTPIMLSAKQMLLKWEQGDSEVLELWNKMNGWVYSGFDETYKKIGSDFDKIYYESNTYLLGKDLIEQGLQKGVLLKKRNKCLHHPRPRVGTAKISTVPYR